MKTCKQENCKMERWMYISGYYGIYEVSDAGRVRSLDRFALVGGGLRRSVKKRFKKQFLNKDGYLYISLNRNNKSTSHKVHRLVAMAFIPNPQKKPCVNHLNGIKDDNRVENLEWCTHSENNIHSYRELSRKPINMKGENNPMWGMRGRLAPSSRPVVQKSLDGLFLNKYDSISDASKRLNIQVSGIIRCCKGKNKSAGGFKWEYGK